MKKRKGIKNFNKLAIFLFPLKIDFLKPCWVCAMPSILLVFVQRPFLLIVYKFVLRRVVFNYIYIYIGNILTLLFIAILFIAVLFDIRCMYVCMYVYKQYTKSR